MKKLILILLTILALTLTACGSASNSTEAAASSQTDSSPQALSGPSLLLIGALKLDGTDQAVTAAQAKELIPLWQVYQSLAESDTAAQVEIDALVKQIEETMTDAQIKAINDMGLTPQDMFALMQEMGLGMGNGQSSNSGNDSNFTPGQGMGPGGGTPPDMGGGGGAPPDMGGGGGVPGQAPDGQSISPEQIATAQAARGAGGFNRVPSALLDALIEYLQKVAGS